jgi:hypothetical protein
LDWVVVRSRLLLMGLGRSLYSKAARIHHGDTENTENTQKEIDGASREAHSLACSVFSVSPW